MPENSSLRNTFSMSRWAIMFPAVARRSPAMHDAARRRTAATIVVACGRSAERPAGPRPSGPPGRPDDP